MKPLLLTAALLTLQLADPAQAGTLANGAWTPGACGVKPAPPSIDDSTVEAFNASVAAINDWQQSAKTYFECLIKEANADNAVIAETANQAQADYRKTVETIGTAAEAAKQKLDKR